MWKHWLVIMNRILDGLVSPMLQIIIPVSYTHLRAHETCEPYVTDHYTESRWDYENGCNASTVVDTYDCNSGLVGSCRTGYIQFYYDCGGHETGRNDQTSTGGCW